MYFVDKNKAQEIYLRHVRSALINQMGIPCDTAMDWTASYRGIVFFMLDSGIGPERAASNLFDMFCAHHDPDLDNSKAVETSPDGREIRYEYGNEMFWVQPKGDTCWVGGETLEDARDYYHNPPE